MADPTEGKMRVLIVFDGDAWFVRGLLSITHDLDQDHKVYRCDRHIAGPFKTLEAACVAAKRELGGQNGRD